MARYLFERFLSNLLALWIIISLTFFLMKMLPGDPFTQEKALPKEVLQSLYRHYHLNEPLAKQYLHYLHSLVKGNLGPSFKYKDRTVNDIIKQGFPISCLLGLEASFIAILFGVTLGTLAALKPGHWQDYGCMLIAILGLSLPSFILAALLQYVFAIKLDWLPVARWGTFAQSILPALSLAALPTAFIARLTRANMIEVLKKDYIKLAIAKGLPKSTIILKHALKNALTPVITYVGMLFANILTGSFVIEKIFGIPGLGQWFVNSLSNRDYTVIMGLTVFYSILLLLTIFLTDMAYFLIDPMPKQKEASC
jgi:oligopeptide transport system permease protein